MRLYFAEKYVPLERDAAMAAIPSAPFRCRFPGRVFVDFTRPADSWHHTVGLTRAGRLVAAGDKSIGACDVGSWRDVRAVAAGSYHTVALTAAGRVVAVGSNEFGQCDVADWREVVAVAAGSSHTLGVRADGTVVAAGNNEDGQCDVGAWNAIRPSG